MTTEDGKKDFFISYNKADRAWAEWIAWELEEAGHPCVIQAWDFAAGGNFVVDMHEGLRNAERTILVLSPDSLASDFVAAEWSAVFAQDPAGRESKLVPVRIRDCKPDGLLGPRIYIDLCGLDEGTARTKLLAEVKEGRAKPGTPPGFPPTARRAVEKKPRFPGTLPPHWNVPHNRNPNFTGRAEILDSLHNALTSGTHATLTQAMAGLGGVGKTQLALEYAYRYADLYDIVWWIRSEDPSTLASDYAALARKLDLPEKDAAEQPKIVEAVRAHLGHITGWLLVFDNVEKPPDLDGYLPQGKGGNVIITSRYQAWGRTASAVTVEKWKREESVEFLQRRIGTEDTIAADALAKALGDFPLALEQAAAYMEETGRPLPEYLTLFNEHAQELLRKGDPPVDYPATVATTWEISFQQVEKESPAAADLLNLCAFLAPDSIPLDVITAGAKFLPESLAEVVKEPLLLDEALRALRRFSLLDADSGNLAVHRLVQAVTRARLDGDDHKKWAEAAIETIKDAFPQESYDYRTWEECARLLPHAIASAGYSEELAIAPDATARVLNQAGLYLSGRAQFAEAKDAYEWALEAHRALYGEERTEVAEILSNLGNVLRELGDVPGAQEHLERALRIDEAAYGPDHPTVAIRLNNLGLVLQARGDLPGAREHIERALRIDEARYGPYMAIYAGNLGCVLADHGELQGAREHLERALRIDEARYAPYVAIYASRLGLILQDLGDLPSAKEHLERALTIGEKALGPDHPQVALYANNLGNVLRTLGDLPGAKEHIERALEIRRKFLGDEHPKTKNTQAWLHIVLREIEEQV